MDIRELPLDDLILDMDLYLRDSLDQDTVERYVDAWSRMPPVTVYKVEGTYLLADGFHRHAAAVSLGKRSIKAEVREGTREEALDFVAGANLFHGLPLTRAERRRAIELKLRLHHERSDRSLAEELCVGRELVAKIRRQLVESSEIPAGETRLGADGKVYPAAALPKDPNERLPRGPAVAEEEEPRPRGRKGEAPWDDTTDPMPVVNEGPPKRGTKAPWEDEETPDARALARRSLAEAGAPSINEMLELMAKQIMDVVVWTQAEGFVESYKTAGANARGLFQTAAIKLAARADQLRKA